MYICVCVYIYIYIHIYRRKCEYLYSRHLIWPKKDSEIKEKNLLLWLKMFARCGSKNKLLEWA
jgi:hypothetical protein